MLRVIEILALVPLLLIELYIFYACAYAYGCFAHYAFMQVHDDYACMCLLHNVKC